MARELRLPLVRLVDGTGGGGSVKTHEMTVGDAALDSEEEAFDQIRKFLPYLPKNVRQMSTLATPTDDPRHRDEALIRIVPRRRRQPDDVPCCVTCWTDRVELAYENEATRLGVKLRGMRP